MTYLVKNLSYKCDRDIIINKHLWFKKDNYYTSSEDGYLTGCDHYKHSEEELKNVLEYFHVVGNKKEDRVNHPSHYTWLKEKCGVEVIDITRHLDFNLGNVIKYLLRAGHKSEEGMNIEEKRIEDLNKALFYLKDEIKLLNERNQRK